MTILLREDHSKSEADLGLILGEAFLSFFFLWPLLPSFFFLKFVEGSIEFPAVGSSSPARPTVGSVPVLNY
jgi:hypothetical protein